jgi:dTDP-4-amino-4,6-dideoxygalactose transaminase
LWDVYHRAFQGLEASGHLRRPTVPEPCMANAHMYYILLPDRTARPGFIDQLARRGINAVSHYVPLHSSPGGMRFSRAAAELPLTTDLADRLVRLPLWIGLDDQQQRVIEAVHEILAG